MGNHIGHNPITPMSANPVTQDPPHPGPTHRPARLYFLSFGQVPNGIFLTVTVISTNPASSSLFRCTSGLTSESTPTAFKLAASLVIYSDAAESAGAESSSHHISLMLWSTSSTQPPGVVWLNSWVVKRGQSRIEVAIVRTWMKSNFCYG